MPSRAEARGTPRRGAAKLDAGKLGNVLAGKGRPPEPPAGAEQRGAHIPTHAAEPPVATPAQARARPSAALPDLAGTRRGPKGISTSLEVPHYLMENIAQYLRANSGHNMRTLLFTGLTKLGIQVAPEDLVPLRQRRSR